MSERIQVVDHMIDTNFYQQQLTEAAVAMSSVLLVGSKDESKAGEAAAAAAVENVGEAMEQDDDEEEEEEEEEDDEDGAAPSKIFACDLCEKVFTRKHNLETHKLVHSQNKPFTCEICKSGFKRSHDLKRHQRMHTGEKPHECEKCNRTFARADALLRHTKNGCTSLPRTSSSASIQAGRGPTVRDFTSATQSSERLLNDHSNSHSNNSDALSELSIQARKNYETIHWKATISQPIDKNELRNQFLKTSSAIEQQRVNQMPISSTRSNIAENEHFDSHQHQHQQASFNQDNFYDISALETNNQAQTLQSKNSISDQSSDPRFFTNEQSPTGPQGVLEKKIYHLVMMHDKDRETIKALESRVARLEALLDHARS